MLFEITNTLNVEAAWQILADSSFSALRSQ